MKKNIFLSLVLLSSLGIKTAIAGEGKTLETKSIPIRNLIALEGNPSVVDSDVREGYVYYGRPHFKSLLDERLQEERLEVQFQGCFSQLKKLQSSLPISINKFTTDKITGSQKKIVSEASNIANFKKLVKPGDDVTTPYGQYTLLMQVASLDAAKYLVNECRADINEAVWQSKWGHYVTALDVLQWGVNYTKSPSYKANLQDILSFLKSKQAKTAGELGFWSIYFGDYVVSSQFSAIQDILNHPNLLSNYKHLAPLSKQCRKLEKQLSDLENSQTHTPISLRRKPVLHEPMAHIEKVPMNTTYSQERESSYLEGLKAEDR
jgi:hypothetical protein